MVSEVQIQGLCLSFLKTELFVKYIEVKTIFICRVRIVLEKNLIFFLGQAW